MADQDLEFFEDQVTKQERTTINTEKEKFNKSVIVLNDDKKQQKDAIAKRLEQRRKRKALNQSKLTVGQQ